MKKQLTLIVTALLVASLLFGCGGKSNGAIAGDIAQDGAYGGILSDSIEHSKNEPGESESDTGSGSTQAPVTSQKLVRKVWLNAETEDLDGLLSQVQQRLAELGGYVENREVFTGSKKTNRSRSASLTVRIPAQQLDVFVAHVTENANITSSNETADDITLSYVATQSRITALETEHARLLELLAKAETMEDLLKIESRLTDVRTELEEVTSQLRLYDNLVDYATVYLNISEVKEYTVTEVPETVWERIGTGFMQSLENLGTFFTELFIFIVVALPYLIPIGIVLTVGILLALKHKKKKDTPTEKQ